MHDCKLGLVLLFCCLLLRGTQCARRGTPHRVSGFHNVLAAEAASVIRHDTGPDAWDPDGPNGPAAHKQALAERIVKSIDAVKATGNVATIADFGLVFTVVVWEKDFKAESKNYLTYGNTGRVGKDVDIYLMFGTRAHYTSMQASNAYYPGLGSPALTGASIFVSEAMQEGTLMSCMIFYVPFTRLPWNVAEKMHSFQLAADACQDAELKRTRLNALELAKPIDLDRLAACMYASSIRARHHRWKGVAAVAAYSFLDHQSPHPDIGIWAPKGNVAIEHSAFLVPVERDGQETVDPVLVYFFSILV